MKPHDSRLELVEHIGRFVTEGQSAWPSRNGAGVDPEFGEIRREFGAPDCLSIGIGLGLSVAEKVHVERLCRLRSD